MIIDSAKVIVALAANTVSPTSCANCPPVALHWPAPSTSVLMAEQAPSKSPQIASLEAYQAADPAQASSIVADPAIQLATASAQASVSELAL